LRERHNVIGLIQEKGRVPGGMSAVCEPGRAHFQFPSGGRTRQLSRERAPMSPVTVVEVA